jgi:hypothetical protein
MNKDKQAWDMMKKYNIQDVVLLEKVYEKMLSWIRNHPNHNRFTVRVLFVLTVVVVILLREVYLAIQIPFIRGYAANLAENGRGATNR